MQTTLEIQTQGKGLYPITRPVLDSVRNLPQAGLLNLFICHTSASLLIQENADPTAKEDLEQFFDLLAPEHQSWHRHTLEGPDDTTSHLKSALTQTSLNIPIRQGTLALGTWQGIYLVEHRNSDHSRTVILTVLPT